MTNCLTCEQLNRIFQSRLTRYIAARSAAFYRVSAKFAAIQLVDLERARSDKDEHLSMCPFAAKGIA
jgi:hypothetical protein